jgi:hypothetical protein
MDNKIMCPKCGKDKKSKEALPSAGKDTCAKIAVAIAYFNRCILI